MTRRAFSIAACQSERHRTAGATECILGEESAACNTLGCGFLRFSLAGAEVSGALDRGWNCEFLAETREGNALEAYPLVNERLGATELLRCLGNGEM